MRERNGKGIRIQGEIKRFDYIKRNEESMTKGIRPIGDNEYNSLHGKIHSYLKCNSI